MSFFKHLAARIGIGSMSVRMYLPRHEFAPGEEVAGQIKVTGGNVPQSTLGILVFLMIEKNDGNSVKIGDYKVYNSFSIQPKEELSFDFSIILPTDCPLTTGEEQVYLMVNVVKLLSIDQRDKKYITLTAQKN